MLHVFMLSRCFESPLQYFFHSSQTLAEQLTDKELEEGRLYPPLSSIREVSVQMAVKACIFSLTYDLKAPVC